MKREEDDFCGGMLYAWERYEVMWPDKKSLQSLEQEMIKEFLTVEIEMKVW